MPTATNVELVEAREGLHDIHGKMATFVKEFDESGGDWDKVTAFGPGSQTEKMATMAEAQNKANELGERISELAKQETAVQEARKLAAAYEVSASPAVKEKVQEQGGIITPQRLGTEYINALRASGVIGANSNEVPGAHGQVRIPGPIAVNALFRGGIPGGTSAGAPPSAYRQDGVFIPTSDMELNIRDMIPVEAATDYTITFLREGTFAGTPAAVTEPTTAVPPEGGAGATPQNVVSRIEAARTTALGYAPELAIELNEITSTASDIMAFLPVTERQLRSVQGIEAYINQRGDRKMAEAVDDHLLDSQVSNNIGFLRYPATGGNENDRIQTAAAGTGAPINLLAVLTGLRMVREKGGTATAVVMEPAVWQVTVAQAVDAGQYPLGGAATMPGNRFWGVQAVLSNRMPTDSTALIGDFAGESTIRLIDDVMMEMSNGYLDYFRRALLALRFRVSLALVVYSPQRFATLTGLTTA